MSRFAEILVISPTLGVRALPKVASVSVVDQCSAAELPTLLQELSPHSIQLFAGVNTSAIRELLDAVSDSPGLEAARPILLLGLPQAHRSVIARVHVCFGPKADIPVVLTYRADPASEVFYKPTPY